MKKAFLYVCLLSFVSISMAQQKMLFDNASDLEIARKAVNKIYNYEFDKGDSYIRQLKKDYEDHPAYTTLKCLSLYQKSVFSIDKDKEDLEYYELLKTALKQADKLYSKNSKSDEAIFFELIVHSYLALYHNENKNFISAAKEGKRTYKYLKKGYQRKEDNPEFYLTSGLLDFYVVRYPEANPMVKPIMWFFPDGDKERGIEYIKEGAKKAIFTKPECYSYLVHIFLKYQNDYHEAIKYSETAIELYPNNLYNQARYAEALVYGEKFISAKKEINALLESDIEFFKFVGYTLNGIYYEKYKNNDEIARNNFALAKEIGEKNVKLTFDFLSMVYNGLARIYDRKGNTEKAKTYYKLTLDIAEYDSIIEEAKTYLDGA